MKERPILFSGPMVQAILKGKKTQTRRIVKPQPVYLPQFTMWGWKAAAGGGYEICWMGDMPEAINEYCPYGKPGDRLWVRETHTFAETDGETYVEVHYPDETTRRCECSWDAAEIASLWIENREEGGDGADNWRPSIHMPRWASRITLEVTGVRVERLQYVTDTDIVAEGIDYMVERDGSLATTFNRQAMASVWDKINGKREGCAWKNNPWVWVVEFSRI